MRLLLPGLLVLLLTSCEEVQRVNFAQPFPASAPNLRAFPVRHLGQYVSLTDSTHHLFIEPTVIWSETMWTFSTTRQKMDSAEMATASRKPGVWHEDGEGRFRLRPGRTDTLRLDKWTRDTLCNLTADFKGSVRWYRGAYYVSQPADGEQWKVERLLLDGRQLSWQRLGNDTLRIAVLPTGVVRRVGSKGNVQWLLSPSTRRQEQQIAHYAGLWVPWQEMERQ